ncbi:MAG: tyrosine--tRNA ligase [Chitinophagales bacterium]|nr:tyrosine--tRNA ligase [Chitinophagales bacterium]
MGFIEELKWRGMLQDMIPETEDYVNSGSASAYIGFDPTSDSLHVGNLATIMLLVHFQRYGNKPIALVGGATGMIGDPSGKSAERNFLDEGQLRLNQNCIEKQLRQFLDFDGDAAAVVVNNYDWMKKISFLDFIRDIGKHITVNYMMAKDSVKNRIEGQGISFTEFSYQLVQGTDFYHLFSEMDCKMQMGGSDQWGNITTGVELIRRKRGDKAFALTCPLVTKADGSKFGKTESGNVWLDRERTSPYKFYQYWINASDEDAVKLIKVFSLKSKEEIESMILQHEKEPHLRIIQKALAEELTERVHSKSDLTKAIEATNILFGKSTKDQLVDLSERDILEVFEGVPTFHIGRDDLSSSPGIIDFLAGTTEILSSKGEARRSVKENSISVNKEKVGDAKLVSDSDLISDKYIVVQKGKKQYFLVVVD